MDEAKAGTSSQAEIVTLHLVKAAGGSLPFSLPARHPLTAPSTKGSKGSKGQHGRDLPSWPARAPRGLEASDRGQPQLDIDCHHRFTTFPVRNGVAQLFPWRLRGVSAISTLQVLIVVHCVQGTPIPRFFVVWSALPSCHVLPRSSRPRSRQPEARMVTRRRTAYTRDATSDVPRTKHRICRIGLRLAWTHGLIRPSGTVPPSHQIVYKTTWQDRNAFVYPSKASRRYGLRPLGCTRCLSICHCER